METSFRSALNQSDREGLGGSQMIIQQYAGYHGTLEPTMQSGSSTGSARNSLAASNSPPLHRKDTSRSLQSSPTAPRSAITPTSDMRSGPSMSPPAVDSLRQVQKADLTVQEEPRTLPPRDIANETIDNAYIAFIFYCNPTVPLSANTYELRRAFRCPPRSDRKNFSIYTLWELIRKLDNKELKTWIQLSIELGVEPPSLEKKQSTQKVQQYAVRLKRWMRAMHVDAFFEYCLGHPHPYYTQLPHPSVSVSENRDGVPLDEDLALRALVPEWKPRRGRKRTESGYSEESYNKRPQLDTSESTLQPTTSTNHSAVFPQSAIPFSAFPDDIESSDPWMTAASSFGAEGSSDAASVQQGHEFRWKPLDRDASPAGYPQSAIIPRGRRTSDILPSTEPRSAVTPASGEKPRSRRRHGPAVSSAWLSNSGSSNGKTRGRPPNKGSAPGPFSSFPVNPIRSQQPQGQMSGSKSPPRIVLDNDSSCYQSPTPAQANARPSKLQLQVPQHPGAPVRLATPPTLLVNGLDDAGRSQVQSKNVDLPNGSPTSARRYLSSNTDRNNAPRANLSSDDVARILSTELLGAKIVGKSGPLNPDEARALASSVVSNLVDLYSKSSPSSPILMTALHLGQGNHFEFAKAIAGSITVNVKTGPSGNTGTGTLGGDLSHNAVYTISYEYEHTPHVSTKVTCSNIRIGCQEAAKLDNDFSGLDDTADAEFEMDSPENDVSEESWKQRYMKLRAQLQRKERALSQYKRKILESVMADI